MDDRDGFKLAQGAARATLDGSRVKTRVGAEIDN